MGRNATIRFGAYRFDRVEGLSRNGEAIPLRPRSLAVLGHLTASPGRLVAKDELLRAVWGDVAVTPGVLNASIAEIRRALDDDPKSSRFIRTVHRRGFRFVARYELEAPGSNPSANDRPRPELSTREIRNIGREPALAQLTDGLEGVWGGKRRTVFVTGGMGIGKTTLLRSFVEAERTGRARSADVAWGQCVWFPRPSQEAEPYHPLLDALDRLVRSDEEGRVRGLLGRLAPSWTAELPLPFGPAAPSLRPAAANATRMLRELCAALEELTVDRPLILVLEDLHWADPETVALVDALATRSEPCRLLLILTFRPGDAARTGHPIGRLRRVLRHRSGIVDLALEPFPPDVVDEWLRLRFRWDRVPTGLTQAVLDRTGGRPLHLVALCDGLERTGIVRDVDGVFRLEMPVELVQRFAHHGFRGLLEHEMESLADDERGLLEAASVLGGTFSVPDLAQASGLSIARVAATSQALCEATSLLVPVGGDGPTGVSDVYTFRTPSLAELFQATLPDGRRAEIERRLTVSAVDMRGASSRGDPVH